MRRLIKFISIDFSDYLVRPTLHAVKKKSLGGVLQNYSSEKLYQIYSKTPVLEPFFYSESE